jgi:hypothetical protein
MEDDYKLVKSGGGGREGKCNDIESCCELNFDPKISYAELLAPYTPECGYL